MIDPCYIPLEAIEKARTKSWSADGLSRKDRYKPSTMSVISKSETVNFILGIITGVSITYTIAIL